MAGVRALLDTNVLIDYLNGVRAARKEIERYRAAAISIVTWMEVMAGALPAEADKVRAFLATFVVHPLTPEIAEIAVLRRQSLRMKLPDAIILATAESEERLLVTRNTRDFPTGNPGIRFPYRL
jgi:predicted nucleic acid-binding protein